MSKSLSIDCLTHKNGRMEAMQIGLVRTNPVTGTNHRKPWRAQITIDGRARSLGQYNTKEEAAQAYDDAAREHFGEFAVVNFPKRSAA